MSAASTSSGMLLKSPLAVAMSVVVALQSCPVDVGLDFGEVGAQLARGGGREQPAAAAARGDEAAAAGDTRAERLHWPYSRRSASESGRRAARIALAAPGMS